MLMKTGILYFTTCFHGFGILRHVDPFVRMRHIYAVASPRLRYLKQLRRCGVATEDQLMFYKSVIAPITEYACPAWHTSLTKNDTETLENI